MSPRSAEQYWSNWSGDIRFNPARIEVPKDEQEIVNIIDRAGAAGRNIRAVGASHSCSPIFVTDDILLSVENLKGFYSHDKDKLRATVGAGMTVEEIGESLFDVGFGMENTGHVNKQAASGAISTGTHGAGKRLTNLSGQVTGVRIITGTGEIKEFDQESDPEMMKAIRVSLGTLGIISRITLKVLPAFQLNRRQYCASVNDCLNNVEYLAENNRNFCFYWYPRRDDVSIRIWNSPGKGTIDLPFARLYKEYTGWSKDVLPTQHTLKYNELEYSFDAKIAPACFLEVRKLIKEKHRKMVGWRVLFRPVAEDDSYLSNCYGRDTVAITVHQNASLPYKEYFDDVEKIFQAYGGRPHWGKKHSMGAKNLKKLYPMWDRFHEIRRQMDPKGIFLNQYIKDIFLE